jgi:hypothetical protein
MPKSKHSEAREIAALKKMEAGQRAGDVAREYGTRSMPGSRSSAAWM